MNEETFTFVQCIFTFVGLLFTAFQIYSLKEQIKTNREWDMKNAAFGFCSDYINMLQSLQSENVFIYNIISGIDISRQEYPSEIYDLTSVDGIKIRRDLQEVLRYYEKVSIGILCDYCDEEIVRRNMNRILITTYYNLEAYIELRRNEVKSHIFSHFERIAKAWSENPLNYDYRMAPCQRRKQSTHSIFHKMKRRKYWRDM